MKRIAWPASLRVLGKSFLDWWDSWIDFVLISTVWFVAQLTIILGPPATFGMFYVINVMVREGESTGVRGLIRGAKLYFGKALLWGLLNWLVVIVGYTAIRFYADLNSLIGSIAMWVVILLVIGYGMAQFYAVPFFMQMEEDYKKVLMSLRNGFFLAFGTLIFTIILATISLILAVVTIAIVIPIFLGFPALIAMIQTRGMVDRLEYLQVLKKDPDPREIG